MKHLATVLAVSALALAAACGGSDDGADERPASPSATRTSRPTATPTRATTPTESGDAASDAPTVAPTQAPDVTQPPMIETAPPVANNPPGFPTAVQTSEETNYEYGDDGNLTGAVTTISVPAAADRDGDPLTYSWTATTGSITGNGLSATWVRAIEFGAPAPGTVVVTASDGRGGTATFTIEFL